MFLHILSIIGIVLLCIAAFVILILLLVLFVPFRYKIAADGSGSEISAGAAVKWLFGFVRVKVDYKESKVSYKVKVLFINILKGEIGGKKEEEEKEASDEIRKISKKEIKQRRKQEEKALKKQEAKAKKEEEKQAEKEKKNEEKAAEKESKKAANKEKSVKEKLLSIFEKIKKIWEKVKTVKYIWDAPVTKRALSFLKQKIFALLNHLKPRKIKGRVIFNLSSPDTTAQIYAIGALVLSAIGADLILEPDFDGEGFTLENVNISGRIFIGYMLLLALKILMNKDVKRVIKYIRRNL